LPEVVRDVPPGDFVLPPIAGQYDGIIVVSSITFTLLYTELGVYLSLAYSRRSAQAAALVIGLSTLIIFAGFLASYYAPSRLMPEGNQADWMPYTLNFLGRQSIIGGTCVIASCAVVTLLYGYLVYPELIAITWLLRDSFLYIAVGALVYQGFVLFIRYVGLLYQTGGSDKLKVMAFEIGAAAFIAIMGLYQYTIDTMRVLQASPAQGLLALHLTMRDILLAIVVTIIYLFQFSRAGDH
jgi:hypothetical protein